MFKTREGGMFKVSLQFIILFSGFLDFMMSEFVIQCYWAYIIDKHYI